MKILRAVRIEPSTPSPFDIPLLGLNLSSQEVYQAASISGIYISLSYYVSF